MSVVHFTFDPEGDLLLRLQYPTEGEDIQNDSEAPFLTSSESTPTSPPTVSNSDHPSSARAGRVAHMLVSSRHLILASPVFKAMFRSGFRESHLLASQELAEIDLPEDDPGAFEILLNIIHGHVRKVPEHVDLKELVELSILIDKYQLLDIMKLYIQMWMSRLRDSAPRTYTADILPWLTISWVFKLQDDFKAISKLAEQGSSNRLCDNKTRLPIPNTVLGSIPFSESLICPLYSFIRRQDRRHPTARHIKNHRIDQDSHQPLQYWYRILSSCLCRTSGGPPLCLR